MNVLRVLIAVICISYFVGLVFSVRGILQSPSNDWRRRGFWPFFIPVGDGYLAALLALFVSLIATGLVVGISFVFGIEPIRVLNFVEGLLS